MHKSINIYFQIKIITFEIKKITFEIYNIHQEIYLVSTFQSNLSLSNLDVEFKH